MKKAFIYLAIVTIGFTACKSDDDETTVTQEVTDLSVQNSNDDKAIEAYLDAHYLDALGNIKAFSSTSTDDDNYPKLSSLVTRKLPSGVMVVVRENAQPTNGKTIGSTDILKLMHNTSTFTSYDNGTTVTYSSELTFNNTINTTGLPETDPSFFYVKESVLTANSKSRSYYEIEGFQEGLSYFKSFEKDNSENYNLQGVIIVPSRAAFARDEHYPYSGVSWRNRTFVFNFQVYNTTERTSDQN